MPARGWAGYAPPASTLNGMHCRRLFMSALLFLVLPSCKPPANDLAAQTAMAALATTVFAAPNDVQTLTFVSGAARAPKPFPFEGFLYAKHWLACEATEPGPFARTAVCRLDAPGRAYASANGWTAMRAQGCDGCETWTVPLAQAKLGSITDIAMRDRSHATVTYTFQVVPNEIGSQLAAWMRVNPIAWCGVDPRAVGGWTHVRSATAAFTRTPTGWQLEPGGFTRPFEDAGKQPARPCLV